MDIGVEKSLHPTLPKVPCILQVLAHLRTSPCIFTYKFHSPWKLLLARKTATCIFHQHTAGLRKHQPHSPLGFCFTTIATSSDCHMHFQIELAGVGRRVLRVQEISNPTHLHVHGHCTRMTRIQIRVQNSFDAHEHHVTMPEI